MTLVTVTDSVRARLDSWPHQPDIVHLVLLDHHMVPTPAAVLRWVADATRRDARQIRTGAMFPDAARVFLDAGFQPIDTLALLEAQLTAPVAKRWRRRRVTGELRTQPMRTAHHLETAEVDRLAFGDQWGNDARSLRNIAAATPRHRARVVRRDRRIAGFAISGLSGVSGYLQRLAVHPDAQRAGIANSLVSDSVDWMRRRGAVTAMVNTAASNAAALALYDQAGFTARAETLSILELTLR